MPDAAGPMRVLFASMPFDGHFLPLTGLARHLRRHGHDARFYTGPSYAQRLAALDVPHLPFRRATEVNGDNLAEHFPEVAKLKGPKRIAFDLEKVFFGNTKAHFDDIREIRAEFAFDTLVADGAFYAAYLVAKKLGVPVFGVGPGPTPAPTSPTAPPPFFGLTPAGNPIGRLRAPRRSSDGREHHEARHALVQRTARGRGTRDLRAQRVRPPVGRIDPVLPDRGCGDGLPAQRLARQPPLRRPAPAATHHGGHGAPVRRQARPVRVGRRGLAGHRRQSRPREAPRRPRSPPSPEPTTSSSRAPVDATPTRCGRASRTTTSSSRTGSTSTRSSLARTSSSATAATAASCTRS